MSHEQIFLQQTSNDTSKNVSTDIGVTGMQGKASETRKTVILTTTTTKKIYQITFEKRFHVNSIEMYMAFERHFI